MFPMGRLIGTVIGRTVRNFTQRSAAVSQQVLDLSSGGGESACSTSRSGQTPLFPTTQAPAASLVNAVSTRLRWDRCHHAASILPFIREKHIAHPAVWEEVLTVDEMKTRLCSVSKASQVPHLKSAAEPENPKNTDLSQDTVTPVHRSETSGSTHQKVSARPVIKKATKQEVRKAHAKVQAILNLAVPNSVHGGKRSWSREEDRVLGAYMVHLAASEVVLKGRVRHILKSRDFKTPEKRRKLKLALTTLRRVRKVKKIIGWYFSAIDRWESRGRCELEEEKLMMYLTLRLEDEADKLDVKKKRNRLENFRRFLRSVRELMSVWHSGE
ncbi:Hypp1413 [Branchiostoma lanceolatum]|uniref:Hypp1413 protein n=1 Tax=Branchiostoma lanceolatum TaxID=7740 RepID=A0A8K0ENM5_BRALA|nr:Hypp1413 [Branchiostoma lanceolatum]